jgi:putative membrane protein
MRPGAIFLRGLAMGAADIVPGVSGGTVAFITGIYPRLLLSVRSFDLKLVRLLLRGELKAGWQHVDGGFLAFLLAGILTSIFSLARLFSWLLQAYPQPLWGFFFGLIFASALLLLRQVPHWRWQQLLALVLGVAFVVFVGLAPRSEMMDGSLGIFLAGFLAICAMILPGISGSFILVLLGMYSAVLLAAKNLDLAFLLLLASGAVAGLICFSRLLYWLLSEYRSNTIAVLTGFLFGSLTVVWPWKRVLSWLPDRHGGLKPVQQLPVLPDEFAARTGDDPMLMLCLLLTMGGFLLVWLIDRKGGRLQVDLQ